MDDLNLSSPLLRTWDEDINNVHLIPEFSGPIRFIGN